MHNSAFIKKKANAEVACVSLNFTSTKGSKVRNFPPSNRQQVDLIHGCHGAKFTGLNQHANDEVFLLYLYCWTVCFVCQAHFGTIIADAAIAMDSDGVTHYIHIVISLEISVW